MYAACHNSAYLSQLAPLSGRRDKVTLVQGAGWNSEFHQFNLNVTQFPTVFRWSDLPAAGPSPKTLPTNGPATPKFRATPNNGGMSMPTGPRQQDVWSNVQMSPRGSYRGTDDTSSVTTDGFHAGIGLDNSETPEPSKKFEPRVPCIYFPKVNHALHALSRPLADINRAYAASETNAPSNTPRTA
jgi:hypothetical protein